MADIEVMSVPDFMLNLPANLDLLLCLYLGLKEEENKIKHSINKDSELISELFPWKALQLKLCRHEPTIHMDHFTEKESICL